MTWLFHVSLVEYPKALLVTEEVVLLVHCLVHKYSDTQTQKKLRNSLSIYASFSQRYLQVLEVGAARGHRGFSLQSLALVQWVVCAVAVEKAFFFF